jgi:hypothetical protein
MPITAESVEIAEQLGDSPEQPNHGRRFMCKPARPVELTADEAAELEPVLTGP